MSLVTHRQRVPAMLAVACVGMLVYSVAGAAPDGKELAPAKSSTTSTTTKCEPTTPTTDKDGDKGSTTTTTEKGGDKDPTTTTTDKGGDKGSTTSTTGKDDSGAKDDSGSPTASKAAAPSTEMAVAGADASKDSGDTAGKAGSDTPDNDGCGSTTTTRKGDRPTTSTTEKDSTTDTTRKGGGGKGGKGSTTTTTERDGKSTDKGSTTSTTSQGGTVEPRTPSDPGSDGSTDPGGSADPGDTPISPQEAPPYDAPDSDPGPAEDPEAAADPGPVESFDMWDDEADVAMDPLEAPGSGSMLPVFNDFLPSSDEEAAVARPSRSRSRSRSSGDVQELAAPPVVWPRISSPAVTESAAVSRRLAGMQTSVTESAFPASIISTPNEFPINHRDPLAAMALVILVGVSRELFKVWRRQASDYWAA